MALVRTGLKVGMYLREARAFERRNQVRIGLGSLLRHYPSWRRGIRAGLTPLGEQVPWITFPAIGFLRGFLHKGMCAFEYGSGGSTLFLARRVSHLVTVEHQPFWHERVREAMAAQGLANWTARLVEPEGGDGLADADPSDPSAYATGDPSFRGRTFVAYARSIEAYPDEHFDLVLIDGRARPSCFVHSLSKVRQGGCILWDNTDRGHYMRAMGMVPWKHTFLDFPGPAPCISFFTRTSAWIRGA